jgi:adenylate cyclase
MNEATKDTVAAVSVTENSIFPAEQKLVAGPAETHAETGKKRATLLSLMVDALVSLGRGRGRFTLFSPIVETLSSLSVRYKIAGTLVVLLALTVVSLGNVTFSRQRGILEQEMRHRAQVLVQQLANVGKEGLLTKQELPVFSTIADFQKDGVVVYAVVTDADGKVFVHSVLNKKGELLTDAPALRSLRTNGLFFQETVYEGAPVLDASLPIIYKAGNLRIGTARIGISLKTLGEAIHRQKVTFLRISLAFMAIGLFISFALAKFLTRPLTALAEGIQNVARGDLSRLVAVSFADEVGKLTEVFNQMILSLREKLHMEKYLSGAAVQSIRRHRDADHLRLGGERKYVTALFSDIRGFTAMSEKMTPEEMVKVLNIYLNFQSNVIHHWGGFVDKFVGDEVVAIFEGRGLEINAVRAAVEIQRYCRALNEARSVAGEKQIYMGIGLNSGEAVIGNMGSEDRMDYTVIGDTINVASRLCSVAREGQIVISKTTADATRELSTLNRLQPVSVKGKDEPIDIHEVIDAKGTGRREMRQVMSTAVEYRLEGTAEKRGRAVAKNISSMGCLLAMPDPIGVGSRLLITIDLQSRGRITAPATVLHVRKREFGYYIGVSFLGIDKTSRYRIVEWVHRAESEIIDAAA